MDALCLEPAHTIQRLLRHSAILAHQVGYEPNETDLESDDGQDRGQDQRVDLPGIASLKVVDEEPRAQHYAAGDQDATEGSEDARGRYIV